jgi:hypothetical protein
MLAGLDRLDQRVAVLGPVGPGVAVLGLIAATHVPAHETGAEVDPGVTHRDALVAPVPARLDRCGQGLEVLTQMAHHRNLTRFVCEISL